MDRLFEVRCREGDKVFTLHTPAKNQEQAAKKVGKGRQIVGVKKLNISRLFGNIEHLELGYGKGPDLGGGVYEGDIDIDSVLGLKSKRQKRRSESEKAKRRREA